MKLDFEELFVSSICALIDINGGSIESAMDDMRIRNEQLRKEIKEYLDWEDED